MRRTALVKILAVGALLIGPATLAGAADSPTAGNRNEDPNAKGLGRDADKTRTGTAQTVQPTRPGDSNDSAGEDATMPMRPGETPSPSSGGK